MLQHTLFALSSVSSNPQQNNAWQIAIFSAAVSASMSLLTLILNQISSHWPRVRKSITYEVTNILFLSQASGATNDISIVDIKIQSISNTLIVLDDYLRPIQFDFKGRKVIQCNVPEQFPKHTVDDLTTFFIKHPDPRVTSPDKLMLDKIHLKENAYFIIRIHVSGNIDKSDIEGWGLIKEDTKGGKEVKLLDKRVAIGWLFLLFVFFLYMTLTLSLAFIFSILQYSILYPIFWCLFVFAFLNILLFLTSIIIFGEKIGNIRQHGWRYTW